MRKASDHTTQQLQDAEVLYMKNENLVYFVLNRSFFDRRFDEDIQQIGRMGLWKACLTYDPAAQFKLSSLACMCIKNEILAEIRKEKTEKRNEPPTVSLSSALQARDKDVATLTVNDLVSGGLNVDFVDHEEIFKGLTNGERQAVYLMSAGYTAKEIAAMTGRSAKGVKQSSHTGKQKIQRNTGWKNA